ncbi:hypothetical protein ABMA27_002179 [Loxostege sticticalis]|uniref:Uncharacterized protein n=1 Tax=Loxostege sticticalis TaxID=481309 RepID=A0ABR3HX25_LOXSC
MPVIKYTSLAMKVVSLGLVIAAASCWAGAGVLKRPKYRDEQTLIGGTVWSQVIIPIGLIISMTVDETLDTFIHGYFLISGVVLLFSTGISLIVYEVVYAIKRRRSAIEAVSINFKIADVPVATATATSDSDLKCDKIYLSIGILSVLAGIFTLVDFFLVVI